MIQGVYIDLVVKYVVPNIIRFSKDAIVKGEFLYGLVQFLSKVKLPNTMAKLATKHAILTTLVNFGLNTSVRQKVQILKVHPKNVAMVFHYLQLMNNSSGFAWSLSIQKKRSDMLALETNRIILFRRALETCVSPNTKEVVRRR